MSIDEVMLVAEDYSMAVHDGRDADCVRLHKALRAAIEQHVAEAVARETERCVAACELMRSDKTRGHPVHEAVIAAANMTVDSCIYAIRSRGTR